jgi:NitT/TauT family transport system substrate-binding protein
MSGRFLQSPVSVSQYLMVAIAWIGCCLGAGCSGDKGPPLRMGSSMWPGFEAFYVARERGLWRDDEVRLVEYPSTSELIRAFRNGAIDAGLVTLDEALLLEADVPDIRIILVTDVSNGADVILGKPQYAGMKDLKGHRIGAETTALGAYMLLRALQLAGMSREDVEIVPLEFSEQQAAFEGGALDAVVTYEPVRTKLLAGGAVQLFDSRQIPGEVVDVLVVRSGYLASSPNAVRSVVRGFYGAQRYFQENPADALRIAAARENVTPDEFRRSLMLLHVPDAKESEAMLVGRPSTLQTSAKSLAALMLQQKLLLKPVDVDSLFDGDALHRISP